MKILVGFLFFALGVGLISKNSGAKEFGIILGAALAVAVAYYFFPHWM